jgi:LAS superfamily LD-carboxypeptidase LdcB
MMGAAYEEAMGITLCITDSYRPRASQEQVFKTKPGLAAVPGTSNHGWGIAVDLCGGVERFGTPQHEWVSSNGPAFGWLLPAWAAQTGSKPEPWHFEYAL